MCSCSGFCEGCLYERLAVEAERHPPRNLCDKLHCNVCGYRDCAFDDYLHYEGDSCPSCGYVEVYSLPRTHDSYHFSEVEKNK